MGAFHSHFLVLELRVPMGTCLGQYGIKTKIVSGILNLVRPVLRVSLDVCYSFSLRLSVYQCSSQ